MFKSLFSGRTPHGDAGSHLGNMFGYFLLPTMVLLLVDAGSQNAPVLAWLLGSVITAGVGLAGGIFLTAFTRHTFNLVQTGRIIQYLGFWLTTWLGILLSGALFSSLAVASPVWMSLGIWALAFFGATIFGEVPKRTWLPVKKRK